MAEEEQEEAGQKKKIFDMAVNMAMTLDISGDKVDTELPLMPLHTVRSCMFEQKKGHRRHQNERARGGHERLVDRGEHHWPKMGCMVKAFELEANVPLHTV